MLVVRNGAAYVKPCMDALLANTCGDFTLRVWDNGSSEETAALLRSYLTDKRVTLYCSPRNFGVCMPYNSMVLDAEERYVAFINSDILLGPDWNRELLDVLRAEPDVAIAGPVWQVDSGVDFIETSCAIMPRRVAQAFGPFEDRTFHFIYYDDSDLCGRLTRAGYRLAVVPTPGFRHIGCSTSDAVQREGNYDIKGQSVINRKRFYARYRYGSRGPGLIIRRDYAIGDVICVTPLLRALYEQDPGRPLIMETLIPDAILHNPFVTGIRIPNPAAPPDIDLNHSNGLQYDAQGTMLHLVDTMAHQAGVTLTRRTPELYLTASERAWADKRLPPRYFVFATDTGWATRNWPHWNALCALAWERWQIPVVLLGNRRHYEAEGPGILDLRQRTELRQAFAILNRAVGYCSSDTGLAHAAGALGVPSIVFYNIVEGRYRVHAGQQALNTRLRCLNCYVTEHGGLGLRDQNFCRRADRDIQAGQEYADCMTDTTAERAFAALEAIMEGRLR